MPLPRWLRRRDPLVCREFVQLVSDYLEGTLPGRERERFEAHLAECDGCEGYLDDVARVIGSLNETTLPVPDPHTRETLLVAFRELRGG
jgi:predicted anti-sigma-YlaC factor YlaD